MAIRSASNNNDSNGQSWIARYVNAPANNTFKIVTHEIVILICRRAPLCFGVSERTRVAASVFLAGIDLRHDGEMIGGESSKRGFPAPRVLHLDFRAHEKIIEADERPSRRERARRF